MAKQPRDPVQFTYESAERIASVVRAAETSPGVGSPLRFNKQLPVRIGRQARAGTFTGSWSIGSQKIVTLSNAPTATVSVQNLTMHLPFSHTQNCIVGKEGTAWYLVDALDDAGGASDPVKLGRTSAVWAKGSLATITLYEGGTPPNETAQGGNLANCVNKFQSVAANKWVIVAKATNGYYYLISAEC